MSVSSDGGLTWGPGLASSDRAGGLGGEPVVQPNGTVIVPFEGGGIDVFSSSNGGVSWGRSKAIASVQSHFVAAGLRNPNLPSASIDGAGKILWSGPLPIPYRMRFQRHRRERSLTDLPGAPLPHFNRRHNQHFRSSSGIGVDPAASGANAHITSSTTIPTRVAPPPRPLDEAPPLHRQRHHLDRGQSAGPMQVGGFNSTTDHGRRLHRGFLCEWQSVRSFCGCTGPERHNLQRVDVHHQDSSADNLWCSDSAPSTIIPCPAPKSSEMKFFYDEEVSARFHAPAGSQLLTCSSACVGPVSDGRASTLGWLLQWLRNRITNQAASTSLAAF